MKTYKEIMSEGKAESDLLEMIEFMECDFESLNEGLDFKSALKKANVFSKDNTGLIATITRAGKTMGLFIWHALRSFAGNEESTAKITELSKTKITKQDLMNFLLNLDMITLHALTGPLHAIEAITGWPIHHALTQAHSKTKDTTVAVLDALQKVQQATLKFPSKVKDKAQKFINKLRDTFKNTQKA